MAYAGSHPIFPAFPISKFQYYPHFISEETEAQKGSLALDKFKHRVNARARIEPGQSDSRSADSLTLKLPVALIFPSTQLSLSGPETGPVDFSFSPNA